MKFYLKTLGCKVNQSESDDLAFQLTKRGLSQTQESAEADLVIVNTCTVTSTADSKARQMVSRAIKSTKGKVVVTGCAVNNPHSGLEKFKNKAQFIKQEKKLDLVNIGRGVARREGSRRHASLRWGHPSLGGVSPFAPAGYRSDRTPRRSRPFLKIQDGCNHSCSYCIVPLVRGPSRSLAYQSIKERAKGLLKQGYKELVLTGVDIGVYEDNGRGLKSLISDLLALQAGFRIRLSSIEPQSLTDELLSYFAGEKRLCAHIHLPLQSGSERVLRLMNRPYTREYILGLANRMRQKKPDIALTTDVIVGFPQEAQKDFEETMSLVKEVGFSKIHIFPYSSRPGAKAAGMSCLVSVEDRKERARQLKNLAKELSEEFKKNQVGKITEVIFERPEGMYFKGTSSNYLPVYIESISGDGISGDGSLKRTVPKGELAKVRISNYKEERLFGKLVN